MVISGFLDYGNVFAATFGADPQPLQLTTQKPHALEDAMTVSASIDTYVDLCSFDIFVKEYQRYYVGDDSEVATRSNVVAQLRSLKMEFPKRGGGTGSVSINHLFD